MKRIVYLCMTKEDLATGLSGTTRFGRGGPAGMQNSHYTINILPS